MAVTRAVPPAAACARNPARPTAAAGRTFPQAAAAIETPACTQAAVARGLKGLRARHFFANPRGTQEQSDKRRIDDDHSLTA
jgi:hypothetical protein